MFRRIQQKACGSYCGLEDATPVYLQRIVVVSKELSGLRVCRIVTWGSCNYNSNVPSVLFKSLFSHRF